MRANSIGLLTVLSLLSVATAARGSTIYVNAGCGSDAWSGASPTCVGPNGPKATIGGAFDAASSGDEIVVADGVYTGADNRDLDFAGRLLMVRSANGPEQCVIDCEGQGRAFVFISGEPAGMLITGFTITGGGANSGGAALGDLDTSMTIEDCVFTGNSANVGGALYIGRGTLVLRECRFIGNDAPEAGAAAVFAWGDLISIERCEFVGNTGNSVGALGVSGTEVRILNSLLAQNDSTFVGGGVAVAAQVTSFVNCVFSRNSATFGSGVVGYGDPLTIANCSFSANAGDAFAPDDPELAFVDNSILWGNTPGQMFPGITVSYSDVEDGYPGEGNIDENPLFASPASDDLHLTEGSPCLDRGSSALLPADVTDLDGDGDTTEPLPVDLDGSERVQGVDVDMGAYEGASEAQDASASVEDFDQGEIAVLVPDGGVFDPMSAAAAFVINVSGPDNAFFGVTRTYQDRHPGAGGRAELDQILFSESTLSDG
ncbi:MAG: right-handed parallel beta-helix repeat-containing protein, partial [Planctomycetota bacterium]